MGRVANKARVWVCCPEDVSAILGDGQEVAAPAGSEDRTARGVLLTVVEVSAFPARAVLCPRLVPLFLCWFCSLLGSGLSGAGSGDSPCG